MGRLRGRIAWAAGSRFLRLPSRAVGMIMRNLRVLGSLEEQGGQWRQRQLQGIRTTVHFHGFSMNAAEIAHAAAGIFAGIAVEHLAPVAAVRNADAITHSRYGSEVTDHQDGVSGVLALPQERDGTRRIIVGIDPLESCRV